MNNQQPLSPHLQVYKLPITAIVSICHRATGIINCVAMTLLVWVLYQASGSSSGYDFAHAFINNWFIKLVLFAFTFSIYFHMCNGIRHLFWDIGKGFEIDTATKTAKACIAAAAALTIITWLIAA
jgi:succinate dehydrogenase / fumarate reductase cytochrome b subunit